MNGEWLIRGSDGRLSVYLVSDGAVRCRAERAPGGNWDAPRRTGGERRVEPLVGVGRGADSYAHLVAWQSPAGGKPGGLLHSTHFRPLLAALDWHPLGRPGGLGESPDEPAVAVDDQGRAHVFVRDAAGRLVIRAQKEKGGWGPWRDPQEGEFAGAPVAVPGRAGRVEVYGAATDTLLHWRQDKPAAAFHLVETAEAAPRPGTLRAVATSEENTTVFYTDDATGRLCAWRPGHKPVPVASAAGPGPVAAVRCVIDGHDCTLLAQRATHGRIVFAAYPSEQEEAGATWTESGPPVPADALVSLALDAEDRVTAACLSPSTGRLLLSRRKDAAGLAMGAWQEV
ncbi:hypothetical protein [Streptomyces sp. NPDC003717]|uniref:hypothetical protein n=1 Tax=Streptomyces sp. NPDC003717 TaxID=3154276 RepID=UPI0033AF82BD